MSTILKILLGVLLFLAKDGAANSAPVIELGTPNNYCVVYCYVRIPFTIANYEVMHKIGRVFCDFDIDVMAQLPIYNGEAKTKNMQASSIGVFKNETGKVSGDVEMSTGIIKKYFVDAKVKSVHCHL